MDIPNPAARPSLSQGLVGWGLMLEAATWVSLCVWGALGWRSMGAPTSYTVQAAAWALVGLPVTIGGYALIRGRRSRFLAGCLVVTVLLNVALAPFAILSGTLDPGSTLTSRAISVAIGVLATVFVAGVVHQLRSGRATPVGRSAAV
jgi:hypothetical protein